MKSILLFAGAVLSLFDYCILSQLGMSGESKAISAAVDLNRLFRTGHPEAAESKYGYRFTASVQPHPKQIQSWILSGTRVFPLDAPGIIEVRLFVNDGQNTMLERMIWDTRQNFRLLEFEMTPQVPELTGT